MFAIVLTVFVYNDYRYVFNGSKIVALITVYSRLDTDPHARRLEHRSVQRNGKNESLGCSLLRHADDFRQLCAVQFTGSHFGRRIFLRGNVTTVEWKRFKRLVKQTNGHEIL